MGAEEPVRISEALFDNAFSAIDSYGDRSDWVELYNAGAQSVSLLGYYLSDDADDPTRFALPDVTLSLLNGAGLSLTARLHAAVRRTPFGDDWDITVTNQGGIAFDHAAILLRGLLAYEARMRRLPRRALPGHRTRL